MNGYTWFAEMFR